MAEQWKRDGRDLSSLEQAKAEFDGLMQQGRYDEAEALLDKALKTLSGKGEK